MTLSIPYTFQAGTKAKANEVNENFLAVKQFVDTLESNEAQLELDVDALDGSKADINGDASQRFQVANPVNTKDAVNLETLRGSVPIGTILMYGYNTPPNGWLICDGSAISRTTYANLFSVIQTYYGSGDGTNTFNIPNLIDKFPEGSTLVGTYKEAGLPNITGQFTGTYGLLNPSVSGAFTQGNTTSYHTHGDTTANGKGINFNASRSSSIYGKSDTVQPASVTTLFIIKY